LVRPVELGFGFFELTTPEMGTLPQTVAALAVALDKSRAPGRPGLGEIHVDLETSRPVRDVGFPVPRAPPKALADTPFDVEFVHVSLVLYLSAKLTLSP